MSEAFVPLPIEQTEVAYCGSCLKTRKYRRRKISTPLAYFTKGPNIHFHTP